MLDRRNFIAATGGITVSSIAGCMDSEDASSPDIETTDGPAEFAVYGASLVDADNIVTDQEVSFEIVIGNRGGESGELYPSGHMDPLEDYDQREVTTSVTPSEPQEVASGEAVTVTTTPFTFSHTGIYEVTATDQHHGSTFDVADGVDTEVEVDPMRAELGASQTGVASLQLSVEDVSFEQSLHYYGTERQGITTSQHARANHTSEDQTYVLIQTHVENISEGSKTVNTGSFDFAGESATTQMSDLDPLDDVIDIDGEPLHEISLDSGEETNAWILFTVDKEDVPNAELGYTRTIEDSPRDAIWELDIGDVEFPTFELIDMDIPDEREHGYQEYSFTIANTGDGDGTFRGNISFREVTLANRNPGASWDGSIPGNEEFKAEIPAGEQAVLTHGSEFEDTFEDYEYIIYPFEEEFSIDSMPVQYD